MSEVFSLFAVGLDRRCGSGWSTAGDGKTDSFQQLDVDESRAMVGLMVAKRLVLFGQGFEQGPVCSGMGEVFVRGRYESSTGDWPALSQALDSELYPTPPLEIWPCVSHIEHVWLSFYPVFSKKLSFFI